MWDPAIKRTAALRMATLMRKMKAEQRIVVLSQRMTVMMKERTMVKKTMEGCIAGLRGNQ
jgi:hypothetical protein